MDWPDYLRDQAESYRCRAQTAEDSLLEQEFLDLAATCEEVANEIEDRLPAGVMHDNPAGAG
jgi:hypothetical protein